MKDMKKAKKWLTKHEEKGCNYPKECECRAVRKYYQMFPKGEK